MTDLVDTPSEIENEIKGAIKNGYMPFQWDSCFGVKLCSMYSDLNSSTHENDSSNAVNENIENILPINLNKKSSRDKILSYLNDNHDEAKPDTHIASASARSYKSEEANKNITTRSEKCVGHNFENNNNFKVCSLEVKKIKTLLDRVKNGNVSSQQSKHNQIMKDLIKSSLFEKWNATKRTLLPLYMNVCDSLRLALRSADVHKIPTILSKAIKQGFTDNDFLHEYAQIVNTKIHEYTFPQLTSILKSFSIPPYKNFKFFSQLCERILHQTTSPDFKPSSKDISDFITSCGRLYYSDKHLIVQLSGYIAPNIESYRPKDLANIYHSLSKLRIHNLELFKLISNSIVPYLYDLTPICLVNLLVSYARTNLEDGEVIYPLIDELNTRLDEMTPMDLLRMTMALSCLKIKNDNEHSKVEICIDNLLKKLYDTCWPLGYIQHLVLLESLIRLKTFDSKLVYGKILPALLTKRSIVENNLSFSENVRTIECIACLPNVNETSIKLLELSIKKIPKVINSDGNLIARLLSALNNLNYESKEIESIIIDIATPKFLESLDENCRIAILNVIKKVKNVETAKQDS